MVRRPVPLVRSIVAVAFIAATVAMLHVASPTPVRPARDVSLVSDPRPIASITDSSASAVDAVLGERVDRASEVARAEPRPARQQRGPAPAITTAVAALVVSALALVLARRRAGRAAVREGRVVPARAPPLLPTSS